jgi:hypothetical protein
MQNKQKFEGILFLLDVNEQDFDIVPIKDAADFGKLVNFNRT